MILVERSGIIMLNAVLSNSTLLEEESDRREESSETVGPRREAFWVVL